MIVVTADKTHAVALSELHARAFADMWSAEFIASLLDTSGAFALAARSNETVAGFILARIAADEAEILTLAVSPEARRKGLARSLVEAAAAHASRRGAKAMFLEVETTNDAARALYAGLGFRAVGERRGYYRDGPGAPTRDALILKADLPLGKPAKIG